jgi:hypothetical protein
MEAERGAVRGLGKLEECLGREGGGGRFQLARPANGRMRLARGFACESLSRFEPQVGWTL